MDTMVQDRYAQIALSSQIKSAGERGAQTLAKLLLTSDPEKIKAAGRLRRHPQDQHGKPGPLREMLTDRRP
jgi:hypothetical protein